ncbi:hypothetical protein BGP84_16690 [Pseudomonas putida]|uniref:Uncharacterized protein n=1 Tax=Pseudomonas putida TaxID=303 RepID=A0A2S3X6S1_PSEPU|nr:hypothetical protein [Pseudomonas putida]POG11290.1 hypothetical protein BGP84_16690 [Pseudomonas putida]POG14795.1 hypothetical protein BGP85_01035 [Pseudomonas putida]
MDKYNKSGLALQKNLLNLRRERDRLKAEGKHKEAERLAQEISRIEAVVAALPEAAKPPTLQ